MIAREPANIEPCRERYRDEVERGGKVGWSSPTRDRRVPQPRAIQVTCNALLSRRHADPPRLVLRKHHAAGAIVRVFNLHDRRRRKEHVATRMARGQKLLGGEHTAATDLRQLHAGVGACSTGLVPHSMRLATDDDVIAGTREHAECHLVRHSAGRQPQRGFFSEQSGHALLQRVDGGILTELVVAHWRGCHRLAHPGRGARNRIGPEIDER